jgi:hypothetical protein
MAGAVLGLDLLDAASLLPTLAGLGVLAGGWRLLGWLTPGLAVLCFMLPLPYELDLAVSGPLQTFATDGATYALQTLGRPAVAEGNVILIDDCRIGVLEACNGLGLM